MAGDVGTGGTRILVPRGLEAEAALATVAYGRVRVTNPFVG
jgi:hypothetical protein